MTRRDVLKSLLAIGAVIAGAAARGGGAGADNGTAPWLPHALSGPALR